MHTYAPSQRHRSTRVWQLLFCLTVLSFLCRSMVPAGYMPDLSGGRDGRLAIALCTMGSGADLLQIDLGDSPGSSSHDDGAAAQGCPFGMVVSQALMPAVAALVFAGVVTNRFVLFVHGGDDVLPPLPALGPPLGSRAPPFRLD